jgi:ribosomal protein L40E
MANIKSIDSSLLREYDWCNRQAAAQYFDQFNSSVQSDILKEGLHYLSTPGAVAAKTGAVPIPPTVARFPMPDGNANQLKRWEIVDRLWEKYDDSVLQYNNKCLLVEQDYGKVIAMYKSRFVLHSNIGQFINNTINNIMISNVDKLLLIINYINTNYSPNTTRDTMELKEKLYKLSDDQYPSFGHYHNLVTLYVDKLNKHGYLPPDEEMRIFINKSVTNINLKSFKMKLSPVAGGNITWIECLQQMANYLSNNPDDELTIINKSYIATTSDSNQNTSNIKFNNINNNNHNHTICTKCGNNGHRATDCRSKKCKRCEGFLKIGIFHDCPQFLSKRNTSNLTNSSKSSYGGGRQSNHNKSGRGHYHNSKLNNNRASTTSFLANMAADPSITPEQVQTASSVLLQIADANDRPSRKRKVQSSA